MRDDQRTITDVVKKVRQGDAALEVFIAVGADHYVSVCRKNRDTVSGLLAQSEEGERASGPKH